MSMHAELSDQAWLQFAAHQVWLMDADLRPLFGNPHLLSYLGLDQTELQRLRWPELLLPDERAEFEKRWAAAQNSGEWVMDYRLRAADGSLRWQLAQARALPDGRWLGSHTDINERKNAETRLRESDDLWKLALESNGDGVWDWYVQTGVETYSPRYLQMYGYGEDEIQPSPAEFDARTHPDDVAQMTADREAHFSGAAPLYSNEHRVLCKDGSWKWILSRGMVISRDEDGRPLRMVGTHTDITTRRSNDALIWQQAHFDALTGLPNRSLLRDRLEQAKLRAQRSGLSVAVLFIDLDQFKEVNDMLGHAMGDLLLIQAAGRIRQACDGRPSTVARMGGDEFTVLLEDVSAPAQAEALAQQILQSLSTSFELQGERVFVSASIGLSLYPSDGEQAETLFKHADQALYLAKGAGRNCQRRFTPELQAAALARARLSNDLHDAMAGQQFSLVYQPIIRLSDGRICKAEALLRWQHPTRGLLGPAEFVPLAEASGLIIEIGDWVFEQVAAQAKRWRESIAPHLQLCLNKSPVQFRIANARETGVAGEAGRSYATAPDWPARLRELGLPGQALAVEITEGLLLEADSAVTERLSALRMAGMQISLDDFGTGFSSLSYLQSLAIDVLKIDRSFVQDLRPGSKNLALCKAIITMAQALDMQVVAEGVETVEQRELLRAAGCDFVQGYLISRPVSAEAFERMLREDGKT
ncbi:putative bifunctional diguanylate cyclase/phosphodiesterase [Roseateles sp. PN1]|uniref:putative bifunctional diguanylate cyclase/phosphodiesterase n=1 Tax=Roseateles sp. PN1 TaxID=3137372 RepID=UPI0031389F3E